MPITRDDAIVLRRFDYSETSQVLLLFCRETGPQRLMARGVKRGAKNRPATGIDLLETGVVMFSRRGESAAQLSTMTEWRQDRRFAPSARDLLDWYAAQYAAEVTADLTETGDPHPGLFDALRAYLHAPAPAGPLARLNAYLLVLLREVGLIPQWQACMECGRDVTPREPLHFSSRRGGLLCRDCEPVHVEKRRVLDQAVALLRSSSDVEKFMTAAEPAHEDLFDMLNYHITETINRPPKLARPIHAEITRRRRTRASKNGPAPR